HLVDLDGAQQGSMQQLPLITQMIASGIPMQVGGGIRSLSEAKACIDAGVSQVVLGSIAINDMDLCQQIIQSIGPDRVVLAVDVRIEDTIPKPATHGWKKTSNLSLWDVVSIYQLLGVKQVLCTDIACDGMMSGPNFTLYQEAVQRFSQIQWQASGGIRNALDIRQLDSLGVAGAILGLCLYQEQLDLSDCLQEYATC
ncbi:MAG: 1-(5-phosphoribosyl)-5-[(5-phosphoribosylamino)methylideneamino] imidazole-4-carboxamide isomerase, partial [Legionella sp.]